MPAWMLRSDGKEFEVQQHPYCMGDEDLSSEADVASFILKTESRDKELAAEVLDAYCVLRLRERKVTEPERELKEELSSLPYHLYLRPEEIYMVHEERGRLINREEYYRELKRVEEKAEELRKKMKRSLSQQFCRVRFGGQYNTRRGNRELWFRISSVEFDWADIIYGFTARKYRELGAERVYICRDAESDDTENEVFYRAKDGTLYEGMDIEEFLSGEHEKNPVFAKREEGKEKSEEERMLEVGYTWREMVKKCPGVNEERLWRELLKKELEGCR